LKIEQFFAVAMDRHMVPRLTNPQPNHYINYATLSADPQLVIPNIISADKEHALPCL
jgi:hypothetical protein